MDDVDAGWGNSPRGVDTWEFDQPEPCPRGRDDYGASAIETGEGGLWRGWAPLEKVVPSLRQKSCPHAHV